MQSEVRCSIFAFVESWYDTHRLHLAVGLHLPMSYETVHQSRNDHGFHTTPPLTSS